jgi:hypothetical protein
MPDRHIEPGHQEAGEVGHVIGVEVREEYAADFGGPETSLV